MAATGKPPRVLALGAGGLIGAFIVGDLIRRGIPVMGVARRFTAAQRAQFGAVALEMPIGRLDATALTRLLRESKTEIVVNCLGLLQDTPRQRVGDIHQGFVARLLEALRNLPTPVLLVQVSVPGQPADDATVFARSKRAADETIAKSGLPHVILRPGFVVAPNAYGGSALLRALAAMPFDLPPALAARPLATAAVEDIGATVAILARLWQEGEWGQAVTWDLMHPGQRPIGDAVANLRAWLGTTRQWRVTMPEFLLTFGARLGDAVAWLGWRPPLRTTALAELRRGVAGDPTGWIRVTGLAPRTLDDALRAHPATVQDKWFARLYALKALIVATLVVFWCVSGLIALTAAFPAATAILTAHGFSPMAARNLTLASSIMDICIAVAIAFRPTSRFGLTAGIALSLFYMAAAVMTPDLWLEPLGALVKTVPAIVLMLVALAISDER